MCGKSLSYEKKRIKGSYEALIKEDILVGVVIEWKLIGNFERGSLMSK